jgi:hypothetical protein
MRVFETWVVLVISIFMVVGPAIASEQHEHRVASGLPQKPDRYISLVCSNGKIGFSIQWNTQIGKAGKYRRHLIHTGNMGNTHFLLKVLPDHTSTGIIHNDKQAKALIKVILTDIKPEGMSIEVFPEGRDLVNGQWEDSVFEYEEFLKAIKSVAKECNWDIEKPIKAQVRTIKPGVPYEGE